MCSLYFFMHDKIKTTSRLSIGHIKMYKIVLLVLPVLSIIMTSSSAQLSIGGSIVPGTEQPEPVSANNGSPNGCICRINNTICSQPGCSAGDNLNCNGFRGNIFYSVYYASQNYNRTISACACPHYQGADGDANMNYINDDAISAYNYTTCDNIVTSDPNGQAPSDVATNAVNCCKYCCLPDAGVGGD